MGEASFKKEESQKHFSLFLALFYCSVEEIQHLGKTGAWIWEQEDWLLQYQKKKIVPEGNGAGKISTFFEGVSTKIWIYQRKFKDTNNFSALTDNSSKTDKFRTQMKR